MYNASNFIIIIFRPDQIPSTIYLLFSIFPRSYRLFELGPELKITNNNLMGGGYYDRDVIVATSGSYGNTVVGKQANLHNSLDPKTYTVGDETISTEAGNPIVFALDVTGSMGEWPKIIYDKLPMFYGQIKMKDYLRDPAVTFCAVGDVTSDDAPLQVTRFGQGKEIDELIAKIWLEGGGGGNQHESYELAAYFYNHYVKLANAEMPFFFVTGDEAYFPHPKVNHYNKVLGEKPHGETVDAKSEWKKLMETYNVFHLKKEYDNHHHEEKIYAQWVETLGRERVLKVQHPKACIDIIIGAICLTSGARDLDGYVKDMEDREQSKDRITEVVASLRPYYEALHQKRITPVCQKNSLDKAHEEFKNLSMAPGEKNKYKEDLIKMKEVFKGEIPETFVCPITREIFIDPVITCDGQSYERSAITEWLKSHDQSPLTGLVLDNKTLTPNYTIKKLINEFHDKAKEKK